MEYFIVFVCGVCCCLCVRFLSTVWPFLQVSWIFPNLFYLSPPRPESGKGNWSTATCLWKWLEFLFLFICFCSKCDLSLATFLSTTHNSRPVTLVLLQTTHNPPLPLSLLVSVCVWSPISTDRATHSYPPFYVTPSPAALLSWCLGPNCSDVNVIASALCYRCLGFSSSTLDTLDAQNAPPPTPLKGDLLVPVAHNDCFGGFQTSDGFYFI